MVNSVDNINSLNPKSIQFKPEKKKTNVGLVLLSGFAGTVVGGAIGVNTAEKTPALVGLTKSEREWMTLLKNSVNLKDSFDMGMYQDGASADITSMTENVNDALILDGKVKELSDPKNRIKSKEYDIAVKKLNEAKNTVNKIISNISAFDANALMQNNLIKPMIWNEAILKRQKAVFSTPLSLELGFLKKAALGGLLGTAAGFIINRALINSNKNK